jgi:hypothetical protein
MFQRIWRIGIAFDQVESPDRDGKPKMEKLSASIEKRVVEASNRCNDKKIGGIKRRAWYPDVGYFEVREQLPFGSSLVFNEMCLYSEKVNNLSIEQDTRFKKLDQNTQAIIETILKIDTTQREYLWKESLSLKESEKAEHAKARAAFVAIDGEKRRVQVELAFLESLRFPEMNYRHERVAEAHEKTFLWAFRDPKAHEKPWDNFVEWLSKSNGIYWI